MPFQSEAAAATYPLAALPNATAPLHAYVPSRGSASTRTGHGCAGWVHTLSGRTKNSGQHVVSRYHHSEWVNTLKRAVHKLGLQHVQAEGSCNQGLADAPNGKQLSQRSPPGDGPLVYCVEPLPGNSQVLLEAVKHSPWRGLLEVVHAAVVGPETIGADTDENVYLKFPSNSKFGNKFHPPTLVKRDFTLPGKPKILVKTNYLPP